MRKPCGKAIAWPTTVAVGSYPTGIRDPSWSRRAKASMYETWIHHPRPGEQGQGSPGRSAAGLAFLPGSARAGMLDGVVLANIAGRKRELAIMLLCLDTDGTGASQCAYPLAPARQCSAYWAANA